MLLQPEAMGKAIISEAHAEKTTRLTSIFCGYGDTQAQQGWGGEGVAASVSHIQNMSSLWHTIKQWTIASRREPPIKLSAQVRLQQAEGESSLSTWLCEKGLHGAHCIQGSAELASLSE